ncbi:hypothetical protein, partial [Mesorhizobium sp. M2E.F.Ca.ET.166.01.1.1]|uniref:hypothetical protein n=1 Tax=Mesorhizobium sp. M2E.F.Ca.ET.166.01.1.1 TaxID=2500523 RepID=UPI00167A8C3D
SKASSKVATARDTSTPPCEYHLFPLAAVSSAIGSPHATAQFQEKCEPVFREKLRENKEIERLAISVERWSARFLVVLLIGPSIAELVARNVRH